MNILSLYENKTITLKEMLLLYILEENNTIEISQLSDVLQVEDVKEILKKLYTQELIEIDWDTNKVYNTYSKENSKEIGTKIFQEVDDKIITVKEIDSIRILLNREIAPFELNKIKEWNKTYTFEEIKEAIYKSVLKGVDNFAYIQKVLINEPYANSKVEETREKKVKKNFDFFN